MSEPTNAAQEYVLSALVYAGGMGLQDQLLAGTMSGADVAQFLFDAIPNAAFKRQGFLLHGVHTHTWWRILRQCWEQMRDLDELKVRERMEASGLWELNGKRDADRPFNNFNLSRLYSAHLAQNGWRYIYDQKRLRMVVDRILKGK